MAERNWTFRRDEIMPSWWPNALATFFSSFVSDRFVLELSTSTTLKLRASSNTGLVAIAIQGRWRYIEADITRAHPGGGAATYDVYVTAADNAIGTSPLPFTDNTDYSFALAIVASGRTPTSVDLYRKVAEVTWSGSAITTITMRVGGATPASVEAEAVARAAADVTLQGNIDAIVGVANFGDGSDGALVFDGTSTVAGLVPAARTYTLTRDIYATSITMSGSAIIVTNGFRIFCTGTANLAGGFVRNRGAAGTTSTGGAGGPALGETTGAAGGDGGASGTNVGRAGAAANQSQGGAGGAGGTGPGAGGAGGAVTRAVGGIVRNLHEVMLRQGIGVFLRGGGGGGGGSTSSSSASGGGGGGGGGVVIIVARVIAGNSQIDANGGSGGGVSGAGGSNGGSGGGGGGGMVVLVAQSITFSGNVLAAGGASGGAGSGTGGSGAAGSDGLVLRFLIR